VTPRASVVVPTCRRPDLLGRCLDALAAQTLAPEQFEVIVVDDASRECTRRQVEAWGGEPGRPAVRCRATSRPSGPAAARNIGWRAARGEIVAFTDDDCVPEPTWLEAGLAALADGAAGAAGRIFMPLPLRPTDYERDAAGLARSEFVTANCFCRRATLAAVGGFDERFRAAWREDSDLFFRLLDRGERIVAAPDAVVVHPVRPAAWGVSLRQQRKSQYNALLYRKHPGRYRTRVQGRPPLGYYATVGAAALAAIGVATRRRGLALAGGAAWSGMTARFIARRLRGASRAPEHVAEMIATSIAIPPVAIFWRLVGAIRFRVLFV
jgi:glycosyltransferase involved in cell wall biosynthesis